jgi:hypothetical protein
MNNRTVEDGRTRLKVSYSLLTTRLHNTEYFTIVTALKFIVVLLKYSLSQRQYAAPSGLLLGLRVLLMHSILGYPVV